MKLNVLLGLLGLALATYASGATSPEPDPADTAAAVITVCGLAVALVVDKNNGGIAQLYSGQPMAEKIAQLSLGPENTGYFELSEYYQPIHSACDVVIEEHQRLTQNSWVIN